MCRKEGSNKQAKKHLKIALVVALVFVVTAGAVVAGYYIFRVPSNQKNELYLNDESFQINPVDPSKLIEDPETGAVVVGDEILIIFKEDVSEAKALKKIESIGGEVVGEIKGLLDYQVRVKDSGSVDKLRGLVNELNNDPMVEAVSLNMVGSVDASYPNDPGWGDSWSESDPGGKNWGLEAIYAPSAWDEVSGNSTTVKIGVVDGGFKIDHEDLQVPADNATGTDNRYYAVESDTPQSIWDQFFNGNTYKENNDHGTHVAGTIGALANNGKGITGAVKDKDLLLYRTDFSGYSITTGIAYLAYRGAKVINLSIGWKDPLTDKGVKEHDDYCSAKLKELDRAGFGDFLIVEAAGNDGVEARKNGLFCAVSDPELRKRILVVGACKLDQPLFGSKELKFADSWGFGYAGGSNWGSRVDLLAPGTNIYSTKYYDGTNSYGSKTGTSMAAPHVTGVAGLLWNVNPSLSASEVKEILVDTADRPVTYGDYKYKILNAKSAVKKAGESVSANVEKWRLVGSGTDSNLSAVCAVDASHVWAVGGGGTILFYDGLFWNSQASGTTEDLYDIDASGIDNAWAVGANGTALHWNGSSWSSRNNGWSSLTKMSGVSIADTDHIFIAAWETNRSSDDGDGTGFCYYSSDAGGSWSVLGEMPHYSFASVEAIDNSSAWLVGSEYPNFEGGWIWKAVVGSSGPVSMNVIYGSIGDVYAKGNRAWFTGVDCFNGGPTQIGSTEDGGSSFQWVELDKGMIFLNGITGVSTTELWAVGGKGVIFSSNDGGASWSRQDCPTSSFLNDVCALDANHVWAVGADGTIVTNMEDNLNPFTPQW